MELVPYVILSVLSVLVGGPYLFRGSYDFPRRLLVVLTGMGMLVWWYHKGTSFDVPEVVVWCIGGMLTWWLIVSLMSPHRYSGISEFVVWTGAVLLVMCGFNGIDRTGLAIMMGGVVVNCVFAIAQKMFKYEIFKSSTNMSVHDAIGFIGNTNMLGNFLVIAFFLSLYLADKNSWWLIASSIIAYTIWITKCRASLLGLFAGCCAIVWMVDNDKVYTFIVVIISSATMFTMLIGFNTVFKRETLVERVRYWAVAWVQIKRSPIFGIGFDCIKNRVPFIQRELNQQSNGKFLSPDNYKVPYPQKMHSDYIQMLCDVGIVGLALYLGVIWLALVNCNNVILVGGLVAVLVTGMFMHNLHLDPLNVWTWYLIFACLRSGGQMTEIHVPWYVVSVILIVLVRGYWDLIKQTLADYYIQRAFATKKAVFLENALKCAPYNGHALVHRGGVSQANNDALSALNYTLRGINHYDGEVRIWDLCLNAAKSYLVLGALLCSERMALEAISFNPNVDESKKVLNDVRTILERGYTVKRNVENKNESKTDVA